MRHMIRARRGEKLQDCVGIPRLAWDKEKLIIPVVLPIEYQQIEYQKTTGKSDIFGRMKRSLELTSADNIGFILAQDRGKL